MAAREDDDRNDDTKHDTHAGGRQDRRQDRTHEDLRPVHDGDDASELRILLERAVPRLHAPEERMQRVRERVARRRRRRAAGAAAGAVAALAVAGALLPGLMRDGGGPVPPAAAGPSEPFRSSPVNPPGPLPTTAGTHVRYGGLAGLTLLLPSSWRSLELSADPRQKAGARGFAAAQPLTAYDRPCAGHPWGCPPLKSLRPGGVLLVVTPAPSATLIKKVQDSPVLYESSTVEPGCRAIGGARQYSALVGTRSGPEVVMEVALCAAEGAEQAVEDARRIVADARFTPTGSGATPGADDHDPVPALRGDDTDNED